MLDSLGVAHLADRIYTELSGGERQLVLIARAFCQEPEVLVMDEPTSNLDFGNQFRVLQQVRALRDRGMAVVMTTHVPDHVFHCAAKVVLLYPGREYSCGEANLVVTGETLYRAYGIQVQIVQSATGPQSQSCACIPVG